MKYIVVLLLLVPNIVFSQHYISVQPLLTNSNGTLPQKANLSMEFGKQWDCFSIGLAFGKTTLSKDTVIGDPYKTINHGSSYLELRPNLNVFQQGKFTNTITFGVGAVFNSHEGYLTELTNGIEYSYNQYIHINIYFGQFYYSGATSNSSPTFFGINIMRYFKPYRPTSIIKH